MKLREIERKVSQPRGIGNNWGEEITIQYLCPCGKGTVTTEYETMTGHKQIHTTINCPECSQNYRVLNPMSRNWDIVTISPDRHST